MGLIQLRPRLFFTGETAHYKALDVRWNKGFERMGFNNSLHDREHFFLQTRIPPGGGIKNLLL
jgi:hypothetical protein